VGHQPQSIPPGTYPAGDRLRQRSGVLPGLLRGAGADFTGASRTRRPPKAARLRAFRNAADELMTRIRFLLSVTERKRTSPS